MRDRLRHALLSAGIASGIAVFLTFTFYERPGLGLGHFFYVSIILAALATQDSRVNTTFGQRRRWRTSSGELKTADSAGPALPEASSA